MTAPNILSELVLSQVYSRAPRCIISSGFITDFTVFILACIVGWQVIWNVTASLHAPLMSVTNAISGIIIVGGMMQVGSNNEAAKWLGAVAIFVATINIAGGFLITHRMLKLFRK